MDTSETYIKMCEKAKEIQEQKKGHVMQSLHSDGHIDKVMGVWITRRGEYYTGYRLGLENEVVIWLPRQDQLQEIYLKSFPEALIVEQFYCWFSVLPMTPAFTSMEQLWLAFVMKQKYNKVWNGGDWITP